MARLRLRTNDIKSWNLYMTLLKLNLIGFKKEYSVVRQWQIRMFKMNKKRYKNATKQK